MKKKAKKSKKAVKRRYTSKAAGNKSSLVKQVRELEELVTFTSEDPLI
jgi:hypothetical protein